MLFENKQTRTERKIFGELSGKIKKSKTFANKSGNNREVYYLDKIEISFDIKTKKLSVAEKSGERIVEIECDFSSHDDLQQKRFSWFSDLLEQARTRATKEQQKANKAEKLKQAKTKTAAANRAIDEKRQAEAEIAKSLEKIKSL